MVHLYVLISCRAVGRDYNVMRKRGEGKDKEETKYNFGGGTTDQPKVKRTDCTHIDKLYNTEER